MYSLGISLIVGGAAFVCSGLVFLLPAGRTRSTKSVEQSLEEIDGYLHEMRRDKRDLS